MSLALAAVAAEKKAFDIPAGSADQALKQFVAQSGAEVVYPAEIVRDVKTPAVKGEMTAKEALERMLAGTDLVVMQDEKSGALTVRRAAGPNASRVAPAATSDHPEKNQIEAGKVVLDKIEVNATKITGVVNQGIIPREENEGVRYNVITRADIERTGLTTLPELMRRVTSNQETGTTSQRTFALSAAGTGNFLAQGDQINLRGFGNGQTLVMINGRRLYGSDGGGADINRIPLAAIERIEILPSSGSAIYGANSGGGVVNVVLRTGFQGTEITTYTGTSTDGGAGEYRFDAFSGMSLNDGRSNLTVSLSFGHQNRLSRNQRDYDQRALHSPKAQPGSAAFNFTIVPMLLARRGMIVTSSPLGLGIGSNPAVQYAAIPAGSNGLGLTPASFNSTAGTVSVSTDRIGRTLLRPTSTNGAALLTFDHAIYGDALGLYSELTWREDYAPERFPTANSTFFLSATDPRNPFRTGVTPGFVGRAVAVYRDQADLADDLQVGHRETLRAVLGFRGRWKAGAGRTYTWSVDGSWDSNVTRTTLHSYNGGASAASQAGLYNIFRDLTGIAPLPSAESDKVALTLRETYRPVIFAGNARLNGDLFGFWGGPAKFSLVAESRRESYFYRQEVSDIGEYNFLPGGAGPFLVNRTPSDTKRNFFAFGGEVELPIVGEKNRKPWLYSLELSAGARYEKNIGYFGAAPPLVSVKVGVTRDLALRVAYQEGFQPPALSSLTNPAVTTPNVSSAGYVDALRPNQVNPNYTTISSGNPDLKPETAKTWDAGVILTPRGLPGLTANVAYFRADKRDVVTGFTLTNAITSFPDLVVRGPASAEDTAAGRPGPVTIFYNKPVNVSRQFTDGVDWAVRYDLPVTEWGRFTLTENGTWTKRFYTQARPGQPNINGMGVAPFSSSFPLENRSNASIIWSRRAWAASVTGSYVGAFESSTTAPSVLNPGGSGIDGVRIAGALTFDVQLSYSIPVRGGQSSGPGSWLGGTKWTIGALNAFNNEPALWTDRIRGFYSPFVDPRQRFIYFEVKKTL